MYKQRRYAMLLLLCVFPVRTEANKLERVQREKEGFSIILSNCKIP